MNKKTGLDRHVENPFLKGANANCILQMKATNLKNVCSTFHAVCSSPMPYAILSMSYVLYQNN